LLSAFSASVFMVLSKPMLARFGPLELTCFTVWAGTLFLLFFAPGFVEAVRAAPRAATLNGLYLGVVPAALANVTWAYALSKLSASRTISFLYAMPPLAILIAWLWLREVPSVTAVMGGAIALCGVVLVNWRAWAAA